MGRKPFTRNQRMKILVIGLPVLVLAVLIGTSLARTSGQPEKPEAVAAVVNTIEVTAADDISVEYDSGNDDQTQVIGLDREAAAGPQLEDTEPIVATPVPVQTVSAPLRRVGIQAGHWKTAELPDELARLRTSTGTSGGGVAEWELNLDIAKRIAPLLEAKGLKVDILPSTIPPGYKADAFVALHADGDLSGRLSGFKLAHARVSTLPKTEDALIAAITEEYQKATGMRVDPTTSRNMTGYYVFPFRRFKHSIAPTTPGVILEMGFMTNAADRTVILGRRDAVAEGVARGILRFLKPVLDK